MNLIHKTSRALAFVTAILLTFGLGAHFVAAQDDTNTDRPVPTAFEERKEAVEARQATAEEKRTEAKEVREVKKEERRAEMDQARKDRILKLAERMEERMLKATVRLQKIADKIESRITKLEGKFADRELDLSIAKGHLVTARELLDAANTSIGEISTSVGEALNSETSPKETFEIARALFASTRDDIKSAHTALKNAVVNVKVGVAPLKDDSESEETTDDDSDDDDGGETNDNEEDGTSGGVGDDTNGDSSE